MAHEDPTFRQRYHDLADQLQQQGNTNRQIAFTLAEEFGVSRLQAFRWAHGHTLKAAAARYNTVAGDPDAPMDSSRLSRYENWPHGARSTQPKVGVLQGFAKTYQCAPGDLIDSPDYTDQTDHLDAHHHDIQKPDNGIATRPASDKTERRRQIRELHKQGLTTKQIAAGFARDHKVSLLKGFRWAHGWTLEEAAERYNNDIADDPEHATMTMQRLSLYENWPHSTRSIPPKLALLQTFAKLYHCAPADLVGGTDHTIQAECQRPTPLAHATQPHASTQPATSSSADAILAVPAGRGEDGANEQTSRYPAAVAAAELSDSDTSCGEDEANRREAIKTLGTLLFTGGTRARKLLHLAESSNVGSLTLDEYDDDVDWLTRNSHVESLPTLVTTADRDLEEVAHLLWKGEHSGKQRLRLELLIGQLSYLQGHFVFRLGEYSVAHTHLRLARRYGEELGNHLLLASVADMETYLALYQGRFDRALDIIGNAQHYATDHTAARLATVQARALAGSNPNAHQELTALLERAEAALPARPTFEPGASSPFGPEMFQLYAATACVRAGHERAREFAEEAVRQHEMLEASNHERSHYEHLALARLDLAMVLLAAKRPEPQEAARLGAEAMKAPPELQNDPVKRRAVELLSIFRNRPQLRNMPEVKELAMAAQSYRPLALPAPPSRPVLGAS